MVISEEEAEKLWAEYRAWSGDTFQTISDSTYTWAKHEGFVKVSE